MFVPEAIADLILLTTSHSSAMTKGHFKSGEDFPEYLETLKISPQFIYCSELLFRICSFDYLQLL